MSKAICNIREFHIPRLIADNKKAFVGGEVGTKKYHKSSTRQQKQTLESYQNGKLALVVKENLCNKCTYFFVGRMRIF